MNFLQYSFGSPGPKADERGSAGVYHETDVPAEHPFRSLIWNGTCNSGQLTRGGLDDSVQHGKVGVKVALHKRREVDSCGRTCGRCITASSVS
jgi:hypothetical protein